MVDTLQKFHSMKVNGAGFIRYFDDHFRNLDFFKELKFFFMFTQIAQKYRDSNETSL